MSPAFTLRVPADPRFRSLAHEVVGRYIEIVGGSDTDRDTFTRAFLDAVERLVPTSDDVLDVVCTARPSGFDVTIRCGSRETVVQHPLPAGKR
jgi:hypothetical protein